MKNLSWIKPRVLFFSLLQILIVSTLHGQDHEEVTPHEHENESEHSRHSISIMIGHTHIPKGFKGANNNEALIVPSWGLNYVFHINEKWAIGWLNDVEIATYVIQEEDGNIVERERPVITSLVGIFRPIKYIGLLAGFGREFEKHHSYWIFRTGVEMEFELNESWAIIPSLTYDLKEAIYDSWAIGLAVAKRF